MKGTNCPLEGTHLCVCQWDQHGQTELTLSKEASPGEHDTKEKSFKEKQNKYLLRICLNALIQFAFSAKHEGESMVINILSKQTNITFRSHK